VPGTELPAPHSAIGICIVTVCADARFAPSAITTLARPAKDFGAFRPPPN